MYIHLYICIYINIILRFIRRRCSFTGMIKQRMYRTDTEISLRLAVTKLFWTKKFQKSQKLKIKNEKKVLKESVMMPYIKVFNSNECNALGILFMGYYVTSISFFAYIFLFFTNAFLAGQMNDRKKIGNNYRCNLFNY
jgi:hypothetical protein